MMYADAVPPGGTLGIVSVDKIEAVASHSIQRKVQHQNPSPPCNHEGVKLDGRLYRAPAIVLQAFIERRRFSS